MTKAEEMSLLGKIAELIASAGTDSYIHDTFNGVVEVCRSNIENDFGNQPVRDLDLLRLDYDAERQMHDQTKRMLADAQKALKEALDLNDKLRKTADEWERNAHDAGDLYCELEEECKQKDAEIIRLRAEIVRMRLRNMTDDDMASLYDTTKGAESNG